MRELVPETPSRGRSAHAEQQHSDICIITGYSRPLPGEASRLNGGEAIFKKQHSAGISSEPLFVSCGFDKSAARPLPLPPKLAQFRLEQTHPHSRWQVEFSGKFSILGKN